MPLPAGDVQWPPRALEPVFAQFSVWSAWYGSDPDQLAALYTGRADAIRNRPSQFRGGVVGALSRMFWGRPIPQGAPQQKLHLPIAADISAKSADMLYSEPPKFDFGDNTAAAAFMDDQIENGLFTELLEGAEVGSALGGHYHRIVWDTDQRPMPWIVAVHHDAAVPEWAWGRLIAVTFWEVVDASDDKIIRHLERHERGVIQHGLYEGNLSSLGRRIDLGGHPSTLGLLDGDGTTDDGILSIPTGIQRLTAEYVPNMRPNRLWRNIPEAQPLGRSDYAGAEGLMDGLDETWTSWIRDIRLGKGRAFVPPEYLQNLGTGLGAEFNVDQELFTQLNMMPESNTPLTLHQFSIRVDEHRDTASELMRQIVRSARYSPKTFGLGDDGQAVTATEIRTSERQSFITQAKKALYEKAPLANSTETLMELAATDRFGSGIEPARPTITFADSISDAPETVAQTVQMLNAAQAVTVRTKVEMLHPDWDKPRIDQEVEGIMTEQGIGQPAPDPDDPFTGPADEDPVLAAAAAGTPAPLPEE